MPPPNDKTVATDAAVNAARIRMFDAITKAVETITIVIVDEIKKRDTQ